MQYVRNTLFESGGHLFVACPEARKMWTALSMEQTRCKLLSVGSAMEMLDQILKFPYEEMMKCVAFIWNWWTERNKANRGERRQSADEFCYTVNMHVSEWNEHLRKKPKPPVERIQSWHPPPANWVMFNTDGAFVSETGCGGWGAVARDSDGELIAAEAGDVPAVSEALHAGTVAVLKAIAMAIRLGCGRIIIATDCQVLQRAIVSPDYDLSALGALFLEAKFLLNTKFIEHKMIYVPRAWNKPAHEFAALGLAGGLNNHQVWEDHVPVNVSRAIYGDSTVEV